MIVDDSALGVVVGMDAMLALTDGMDRSPILAQRQAVAADMPSQYMMRLVVAKVRRRPRGRFPEKLIGDRAYDSDGLDAELSGYGVEMIAPHNPTRKTKTRDARRFVATAGVGTSSGSVSSPTRA